MIITIQYVIRSFYMIFILVLTLHINSEKTSVRNVFGKFGSVKIDLDPTTTGGGQWTKSWPDGIKLVNNMESSRRSITILPKLSSFQNINGYPYSPSSISIDSSSSSGGKQQQQQSSTLITPRKRTYTWQGDDLIISVNMTALNNPSGTRLVPPITWISASEGTKVKVMQQTTASSTTPTVVVSSDRDNIMSRSYDSYSDAGNPQLGNSLLADFITSGVINSDKDSSNNGWPAEKIPPSPSSKPLSTLSSSNNNNRPPNRYGFGYNSNPITTLIQQDNNDSNSIDNTINTSSISSSVANGNNSNSIVTNTAITQQIPTYNIYSEANGEETERVIEITVRKQLAEDSLSCLRMFGFNRSDIYRMLDKGPWILAFDISKVLPRLFTNIKTDLNLNQSETVHILSHCPYLIAQYQRYKGRDVSATTRALIGAGYLESELSSDLRRFPSMLSAPPDRILGWMNLLSAYGIASGPGQFGKYVRRAPFMFNINAPQIFDSRPSSSSSSSSLSTTASDYVAYDALAVLDLLWDLKVNDLNKVMRTQPLLLITNIQVLKDRITYLGTLLEFLYNTISISTSTSNTSGDRDVDGTATLISSSNRNVKDGKNEKGEQEEEGGDVTTTATATNNYRSKSSAKSITSRKKNNPSVAATTSTASTTTIMTITATTDSEVGSNEGMDSAGMNIELDIIYSQYSYIGSSSTTILPSPKKEEEEDIGSNSMNSNTQYLQQQQPNNIEKYKLLPEIQKGLASLILTYPAILSIEKPQMIAAIAALYEEGLTLFEIVKLLRLFPPLLNMTPSALKGCMFFLKQYCGLRKMDLYPFLQKNPNILSTDIATLAPKKDYLFRSLGGTTNILKRCPSYLCYDLDTHIIPRAEFVRALGKDPLFYGLSFLITSKEKDLVYAVGSTMEIYNEFKKIFGQKWMERKTSIKGIVSATKNILKTVATSTSSSTKSSSSYESRSNTAAAARKKE